MPKSSRLSHRKESWIRGLGHKSVRGHRRRFIAEGLRVVEEALASPLRVADVVGTPSTLADIELWAAAGRLEGVDVAFTDERTFRSLSDSVHPQGVLAVVEERPADLAAVTVAGPVLLLDRLQDPGNAGTLLRSLHATGGRLVLALKGTVDLYNPKVVRASAGSLFHLDLALELPPGTVVEWIQARRLALFALDQRGTSVFEGAWSPPPAFVLAVGNEPGGIAAAILEGATRTLAIPMAAGVDSLNAAVAGSVALYELHRRQGSPGSPPNVAGGPAAGAGPA